MTLTACLLATAPVASAGDTQKVPARSEVEEQYRWNLDSIFTSMAEWEKEYAAVGQQIADVEKFRGRLSESAETLLAALKLQDDTEARLARVYVYTSLLSDQDTRIGDNQALKARARALAVKYGAATSWASPELTSIDFNIIEGWMAENEELAVYAQTFDDIFRQKKHILSEREEKLISLAGEIFSTPGTTYNLFANADLQYPTIKDTDGSDIELSDSAFYILMRSPDRRVRADAYKGIVGSYAKFRNTAASLLNGAVQNHIFSVKARGYDSCLAAALDDGNIPVGVYNNLINTVNDNLPLLHRYQSIRKRALKLHDGVHAYDLFAPFVSERKLEYSYEEGVEAMYAALAPLGPDYLNTVKQGVESRWIDVYPNEGKRSGAYSSGTYLTQPFILLNFHGGYDEVSTLAHEMGHSMHSYLSRSNQPYTYASYDIFCAEVASVTNEILLQDYTLERIEDPQLKLYLLVELLEGVRGTLFRQTMFSEFEQRIHEMAEEGIPLTADSLDAAYGKIMKKYYGPDYTHDELVNSYWIRIPHFYYNFYVYKYATSYCASANIARRIREGEPGAVEAYLQFLKSGSSQYPIDLLKAARVDMTSAEPINDAMRHFGKLLDQTEELLDRIE
ncbi:MAG: oligoendopeptidase F [Planctomycetota bacterium]